MEYSQQEQMAKAMSKTCEEGESKDAPGIGLAGSACAPARVPDRDTLLRWINDAERSLIEQLGSLQKAKDRIQYADEFTCGLVKEILEAGASPRQR